MTLNIRSAVQNVVFVIECCESPVLATMLYSERELMNVDILTYGRCPFETAIHAMLRAGATPWKPSELPGKMHVPYGSRALSSKLVVYCKTDKMAELKMRYTIPTRYGVVFDVVRALVALLLHEQVDSTSFEESPSDAQIEK